MSSLTNFRPTVTAAFTPSSSSSSQFILHKNSHSSLKNHSRSFALIPRKNDARAPGAQRHLPYIPPELTKDTTKFLHSDPCCKELLSLVFAPSRNNPDSPVPNDTEQDREEFEIERAKYLKSKARFNKLLEHQMRMLEKSTFKAIEMLPAELHEEAVGSDLSLEENGTGRDAADDGFASSNDNSTGSQAPAGAFLQAGNNKSGGSSKNSARSSTKSGKSDNSSKNGAASKPGCFTGQLNGTAQMVPNGLLWHQMYGKQWFNEMDFRSKQKLQIFQNLLYLRYPHTSAKEQDEDRFWIPESKYVSRQREAAQKKRKLKG